MLVLLQVRELHLGVLAWDSQTAPQALHFMMVFFLAMIIILGTLYGINMFLLDTKIYTTTSITRFGTTGGGSGVPCIFHN